MTQQPSLLPPNATTLERALEAATARIDKIPSDLRVVWSPTNCPEAMLPWLAWALSLDSWSPDWPVAVKRERVRRAVPISKQKGTADSVRSVVESFGGAVVMRDWWEAGGSGKPFTFDLVLTLSTMNGALASAAFVNSVIAEVGRAKPVRAHFNFTMGINAFGGSSITAAARPAAFVRLSLAE